jgi:hypothetical protein
MDWPRPLAKLGFYSSGVLLLSSFTSFETNIQALEVYCEQPGDAFVSVKKN